MVEVKQNLELVARAPEPPKTEWAHTEAQWLEWQADKRRMLEAKDAVQRTQQNLVDYQKGLPPRVKR